MAKLREDQNFFGTDKEGVVLAKFGAFSTVVTYFFIHLWNWDINRFRFIYFRAQKQMDIGFLHVAIQELNILER